MCALEAGFKPALETYLLFDRVTYSIPPLYPFEKKIIKSCSFKLALTHDSRNFLLLDAQMVGHLTLLIIYKSYLIIKKIGKINDKTKNKDLSYIKGKDKTQRLHYRFTYNVSLIGFL